MNGEAIDEEFDVRSSLTNNGLRAWDAFLGRVVKSPIADQRGKCCQGAQRESKYGGKSEESVAHREAIPLSVGRFQ
jgi:hypothetical protein